VPLAYLDPFPPGIVQEQLVEFRPFDLVSVGASDEWFGNHIAEVDVHYIATRAPPPHTAQFWCEPGLCKRVAHPENLADPESVRESGFSNLVPRQFFLLKQKDSVAAFGD
jgi:hypothetical protein